MKRGSPLKRTPLARGSKPLAQARKPMARGKRLMKVGRRAKREAPALEAFREVVLARANYTCERCGASTRYEIGPDGVSARITAVHLEAHHRLPRARGGTHDPENGACLCGGPNGCHAQVTDHRASDWRIWTVATKPG